MAAVRPVAIRTISVDTVSWTAILPPFDCNEILVRNEGDWPISVRSDDTASGTTWILQPGEVWAMRATGRMDTLSRTFSYLTGEPVLYAQAASGTGPLRIRFS